MILKFGSGFRQVAEDAREDNDGLLVEDGVESFAQVVVDAVDEDVDHCGDIRTLGLARYWQVRWSLSTQTHWGRILAEQLSGCWTLYKDPQDDDSELSVQRGSRCPVGVVDEVGRIRKEHAERWRKICIAA